MKKYLLDSHTLIWAIVDDNKLSKKVLEILQDSDTQLFVSAVSFWEIAIKHGKEFFPTFATFFLNNQNNVKFNATIPRLKTRCKPL